MITQEHQTMIKKLYQVKQSKETFTLKMLSALVKDLFPEYRDITDQFLVIFLTSLISEN